MRLERFIERREPAWGRLGEIVDRAYRRGARGVSGEQAEEMVFLYRQVASDLARLRAAGADPGLVRRVNRLLTRAHAQIYRGRPRRSFSPRRFFAVTYPRLFRRSGRHMLASFLLCAVVYAMAYQAVQERPELVADILGGGDAEFMGPKTAADIQDRFRSAKENLSSPVFSSLLMTNNIRVALLAFALGITFGVGTVFVLVLNSAMVGGIAGAFARSGIESTLWATLLPHGALELSAIVVAGGAGLTVGWALWCPGQRTRRRALREETAAAVGIAVGLVPAFVVAGLIEGFITPSETIPQAVKVALGVAAAAVFWAYVLLGGRGAERVETSSHKPHASSPITADSAALASGSTR